MGVGNFFGMLPDTMRDSRLYGVELDSITGSPRGEVFRLGNDGVFSRFFVEICQVL